MADVEIPVAVAVEEIGTDIRSAGKNHRIIRRPDADQEAIRRL